VKNHAKVNHSMGAWSTDSKLRLPQWITATFMEVKNQLPLPEASEVKIEFVTQDVKLLY
jgi:isocitrate dehydrogenase